MILRTKYVQYEISESGKNVRFSCDKAECKIKNTPCSFITNNDRSIVDAVGAKYEDGILSLTFSDGTDAKVAVAEKDDYLTFTLKEVSREDFISIAFVNIEIEESGKDLVGCLMGMTLSTHMAEHPGDNSILRASAYPHIGLYSTRRSSNPAKAAVIGAPLKELREIQKKVIEEIPSGELPISKKGGPWADTVAEDARGLYSVFSTTVTDDNFDDVLDSLKKFSLNQITLHHYGHYTQGDFKFDKGKYPNGMEDFKRIVDRFHKEGILVGLQTYCFFAVADSSYVSPVPHKDLDTLREFTLKCDMDEETGVIEVIESTEGMTSKRSYVSLNSPYLWIDDELIEFTEVEEGRFVSCKRGAYNTIPASHKKGSRVRQLKEYFFIPLARVNSDLFYEIARNTAKFYNESGADYFYLDAIDAAFILDGEDYAWYHGADFIREMFEHLEREPIFDCCYNPAYTASWYARSRYGAVDESLVAHRQYVDAHLNYNLKTADKMGITPELGWINFYTKHSAKGDIWQCDPFTNEDLEYISSKVFATGASLAFLRYFHEFKNLPCSVDYSKILKKYADYKKNHTPSEKTKEYLIKPECGAFLDGEKLIQAKYPIGNIERKDDKFKVENDFKSQNADLRIDTLYAAGDYDSEDAVTLLDLDENDTVKDKEYRFDTPINSNGNMGLGVWCYGDGSGATVCIALRNFAFNTQRNSQHFIKADFKGWKYFAFHENQNGTLPAGEWPRKELEYTTYTNLQKFYHQYRVLIDYNAIDGVDITVKGSENIRLKPIKFVPLTEPCWVNPTIKTEKSVMKINTTLSPDDILTFDGKECVVKNWQGYVKDRPQFEGEFIIPEGKSEITLSHEGEDELSRARVTVSLKGEILQ